MTRFRSLTTLEAGASVLLCWLVALVTQLAIFPAVGLQVTLVQQIWSSLAFTTVSHLQSYRVRQFLMRLG